MLRPRGPDGTRASKHPKRVAAVLRALPGLSPAGESRVVPCRSRAALTSDEKKRAVRAAARLKRAASDARTLEVGKSFLESNVPLSKTVKFYRQLLAALLPFLLAFGINLASPTPAGVGAEVLDSAMVDWSDMSFFDGHPASFGEKVHAALQDWWPQVGRSGNMMLPRFARARRAWRRLAPGSTRVGLPWSHLVLVVHWLLSNNEYWAALAMVLMFSLYLRPSELLSLLWEDLVAPTVTAPFFAFLMHPEERGIASKIGDFGDGVQIDSPLAPWLGPVLGKWKKVKQGGEPVIPLSYLQLKTLFQSGMAANGFDDPSMYRLRHGGASEDRARNLRSIEAVKKRGRWVTDAAVRRYEKSVRLQQVEQKAPDVLLARAATLEKVLPKLFGA